MVVVGRLVVEGLDAAGDAGVVLQAGAGGTGAKQKYLNLIWQYKIFVFVNLYGFKALSLNVLKFC